MGTFDGFSVMTRKLNGSIELAECGAFQKRAYMLVCRSKNIKSIVALEDN